MGRIFHLGVTNTWKVGLHPLTKITIHIPDSLISAGQSIQLLDDVKDKEPVKCNEKELLWTGLLR